MSLASMRAYTETRVRDIIAAHHPGVPIRYDNVPFAQPKDTTYIAVHILDGASYQANLGVSFTVRYPGVVQIDIVTPLNSGKATQHAIAETLTRAFTTHRATLPLDGASVQFRTASPKDLGEQGPWCLLALSIGFTRDERFVPL